MKWIGGLDGLRAIAVIAVVLFHLDAAYLPGGFLGVDLFFVISGYLITRLLIAEWRSRGRIALGAFYARRARRLLPAVAVLLAVVAVGGGLIWTDQRPVLAGGVASSALYVTNWWMIADQQSYFVASGRPPLLQHLWSLAIEEQFYLLWAPAVVLLASGAWVARTRLGRRVGRAGVIAVVAAALALVSTAAMAWIASGSGVPFEADSSRVYFGTDTHAMGLLLGAAVGALAAGRRPRLGGGPMRRGPAAAGTAGDAGGSGTREMALLRAGSGKASGRARGTAADRTNGSAATWRSDGATAAALTVLAWFMLGVDEYQPWLYRGGFLLFAAVAVVAVSGAARPGSRIGRALDLAPLRWIGRRSYGIYLWHWPVFAVTRPLIDVSGPAWLIDPARAGLAVAVAALSYRWIEEPIRRGRVHLPALRGLSARVATWKAPALPRPSARHLLAPGIATACVAVLVAATLMTPSAAVHLAGTSVSTPRPVQAASPGPASGGGTSADGATSSASAEAPITPTGEVTADEPWTWGEDFADAADEDLDADEYIDEADGGGEDAADDGEADSADGGGAVSADGSGAVSADGGGGAADDGEANDGADVPDGEKSRENPSADSEADSGATIGSTVASEPDADRGNASSAIEPTAPVQPDGADSSGAVIPGKKADREGETHRAARAARKPPRRVSAFGDSVLLGAAPALQASVPKLTVDAEVGRQSWDTLAEIERAAQRGQVATSVVIHTGNNGIIPPDQLARTLKDLRGLRVVLVNTHVDRTWSRPNNKVISAAQKKFPNVTVVDWNKAASAHPGWFGPDGMHVNGTGAKAYAKLVLRALA